MTSDPIEVALLAADAFEACGLRYLVGGSVASSFGGEPRGSLDVDIVVELLPRVVPAFIERLKGAFYADEKALRRAAEEHSSANIVHLATSIKIDLFIAGGTPLDAEQMDRRQRIQVASDPDRFLYVHSPEDILLQKLRWYRLGAERSDRQWRDILGIVHVQGERLDETYLRRGAAILKVEDLLARALSEGAVGSG